VEVDINLLPEKERNKILLQREREAQKAKDKAEKEAKKVEKSRKSKASTLPLLLIETSISSPSQNPHKRDASYL
jgi:hypothetical protein